jgi:transcriptional regulator with XRE-family HTH domain
VSRYQSAETIRQEIKARIGYDVTQRSLAKQYGISAAYLSDFLAGNREAGPKILKALGYESEPFYRKAKP